MGIKGVRHIPKYTQGGLKVVSQGYAIKHKKHFVIGYQGQGRGFVVETITSSGKPAKRQIRELWDSDYRTQGEAKHAIRAWDLA